MDDPAAALNMTDRRWHKQVEDIVRKGEAEEQRKKDAIKVKNAAIWEE